MPVVGVLFGQLLTLHGALNTSLQTIGLGGLAQDWLGDPDWALRSLAGRDHLAELGFGVILFLARLLSLPPNVFDAARVDGAGWFRTHWHVTLPMMRSIIGFYLVIEAITLHLVGVQLRVRDDRRRPRPGHAGDRDLHLPERVHLRPPVARGGGGDHPADRRLTAIAGGLLVARCGYIRWRPA